MVFFFTSTSTFERNYIASSIKYANQQLTFN